MVLLTGLVYVHALAGTFLSDDQYFYLDNPRILTENITSAFTSDLFVHSPNKQRYYAYRPLALLAYSWQARLFGLQPFGLHFSSVALHAVAGILVFLLVLEFAEIRVAWVTAALFLVHPLHVEAVAWMTGLSEVLGGALVLLSLYTLLRAHGGSTGGAKPAAGWLLAASYLAAGMAFLTKETAMALPLMAALFVGLRAWPFFAIAAGTLLLRFLMIGFVSAPLPPRPLWWHLGIMETAALHYVKKMIWPWPLAPEYDLAHPPAAWVTFAVGCALAAWMAYRHTQWRLSLLLLIAPLTPALAASLIHPALRMAQDRNAYLAILGFVLGIGYGAKYRAGAAAALTLLLLWSALSVAAIRHWRDPDTLWTHTLRVTPNSKTAVISLGYWYFMTERYEDADRIFQQGLALRPNDPDCLAARAALRKVLGSSPKTGPSKPP